MNYWNFRKDNISLMELICNRDAYHIEKFFDTTRTYEVRVTDPDRLPPRVRLRDIPPGMLKSVRHKGELIYAF